MILTMFQFNLFLIFQLCDSKFKYFLWFIIYIMVIYHNQLSKSVIESGLYVISQYSSDNAKYFKVGFGTNLYRRINDYNICWPEGFFIHALVKTNNKKDSQPLEKKLFEKLRSDNAIVYRTDLKKLSGVREYYTGSMHHFHRIIKDFAKENASMIKITHLYEHGELLIPEPPPGLTESQIKKVEKAFAEIIPPSTRPKRLAQTDAKGEYLRRQLTVKQINKKVI
jgi:hypothetical protein